MAEDSAVKTMVGSSPTPDLGQMMAQRSSVLKPYEESASLAKQKEQEFGAEKLQFEQAQKAKGLQVEKEAIGAQKTSIEEAYKPLETLEKNIQDTTFIPSEATATDLAALYGLIGVVGWGIGAGGKGDAMQAMSAMNGMLEGYQKGRQDIYKKEKEVFDLSVRNLRERARVVAEGAKRIAELSALDRDAAKVEQAMLVAQESATFYKDNAAKFGYAKASQDADDLLKAADKMFFQQFELASKQAKSTGRPQKVTGEDGTVYMVEADGIATPVETADGRVIKEQRKPVGGAGGGKAVSAAGADRYGFGDIVATNLNEAVGTIANIVNLPYDVTSGIFQGRNTTGLLTAPLGALTNALTTEDVQRYNKEIKNFGKFASRVVSGGRVVPASVQKDFEDQFLIREGDSPLTVLTSIAQMRQTIERAAEVKIASSSTDPGLKQLYIDGLDVVRNSIPFTINDVNRFANERDKNKTLANMFEDYGFQKSTPSKIPQPKTQEEYNKIQKGTKYIDTDGKTKIKG